MAWIKGVEPRGPMAIVWIALACSAGLPAQGEAGQYEQPPSFQASQVLPQDLLSSPNYTLNPSVGLENFQYVFHADTSWGPYVIKGSGLMQVRAREMAATAALANIDSAGTVVNAAGRTALKPLATAKDLLTEPGKTIGDTFRGVGNVFNSAGATMSATDPHKEGIVASVTGGATARRKLAYDFGVDPNTSFPPLSEELTRLATANAIGETSANAGLAFITGGAGIAISVGGTSRTLRLALRDKTAAQLEKEGRRMLAEMGVSQAAIDAFYANPHLSPTDKAIIAGALMDLGATSGREIFIQGAANAQTVEMAFFYRRQAELIAVFNKKVSKVNGFERMGGAPLLNTGKGTVSILPVDYLYWSPPVEALIGGAPRGQLWITGRASQVATAQLAARGWTVVPKAGSKLGE